jgi:ABC-type nickel/cobalt efflux system permease component RcnA
MPRALLIAGALVGAGLALLWLAGAGTALEAAARDAARTAQDGLARAIRALRAGEPGALALLLGVAFGYGLAHAAGPGHGKFLIGGYALARRSRLAAFAGLALVASLAQATVAVALVLGGAALFDRTRAELARLAEIALPPFAHAAIAALGIWLMVRGLVGFRRAAPQHPGHERGHGQDRGHHDRHADCGHRHGPTPAEVAALTGWRDAALLVAGIALRPCTGAVFLLVLTWQAGILPAGIAAAYAMGLGTAAVTMATAALAVWAREGAFAALPRAAALRGTLPAIETVAGVAIAATGLWLLARAI